MLPIKMKIGEKSSGPGSEWVEAKFLAQVTEPEVIVPSTRWKLWIPIPLRTTPYESSRK
jgi:hypothetical protein